MILLLSLSDREAGAKPFCATNYEWKTRQETRELGGRAERGLMGTKFMLKILGGSQATGLWLGASPNREPHFHMQVSLWHVYSPSLGRHSFTRKTQPLNLWEGSSPWAVGGGGLHAFGWQSTVPIRVNYRAHSS